MNKGIYIIISPVNKIYIGQSKDLSRRQNTYSKLFCKKQVKLYNSLKKYGWNKHKFIIIKTFNTISQKLLNSYELAYWKFYKNLKFTLLNIKIPGIYPKQAESSKKKISNSRKGIVFTEEHRLNLSKANKGKISPNIGKKLSKEHIQKMKDNFTGKSRSKEIMENLHNSVKRKIIQLDMQEKEIKIWNSITDAANFYNLDSSRISKVCKKAYKCKSTGGFKWKYASQALEQ